MKKLYSFLLLGAAVMSVNAASMPRNLQVKKAVKRLAGIEAPVTLPATDITEEGFTANWKAVPGAESYSVLVYEPTTVATAGTYAILHETFDLVSEGTTIDPFVPDDAFVELSAYDWTYTPDWQGYWPVFARGMVGGIIYSPYIDLGNDGGKFTVTINVSGTAGGQVVLTSTGDNDSKEKVTFDLTLNGINTFTHTFTNGCHDTFLTFVDNGIINDPEGEHANVYDFLDDITVTQNLKAGDLALRLVGTAEAFTNHQSFAKMPYRYGATKLAYDVQANIVTFGPDYPDDWYDYEVERTPYSQLEYVTLLSSSGGEDPIDPDPVDPDDPVLTDNTWTVGNFDNPTDADIEDGTWWNRAPYQWYTRFSASQFIYDAEMLAGLKAGDIIKEITFKYQDQGAFTYVESNLWLSAQNSEITEFAPKPDTEKYPWIAYNDDEVTLLEYEAELYYQNYEEFTIVLEYPLVYDGKSIVLTCWSENLGEEAQAVASVVKRTSKRTCQVYGSDTDPFQSVYESGFNYPYQTPEKFVPVVKFTVERPQSGVSTITIADDDNNNVTYFDLQGRRVVNPSAGIYLRHSDAGVEKVLVK